MDPLNVLAKVENLKSVAFPIPEIIGGTRKNWAFPRYAHTPFSKIFNELLFGLTLLLFWPNLKFVALPFSELIAIGVLGLGGWLLGYEERRG